MCKKSVAANAESPVRLERLEQRRLLSANASVLEADLASLRLERSEAASFARDPQPLPVADGLEGDVRGGGGSPVLAKENGVYYHFTGGPGVRMRSSTDTVLWHNRGQAFSGFPQWVNNSDINPDIYWAPDIVHMDGEWHLYYTVSTLGSNRSAIGVATSPTLNPNSPDYQWTDQGMVIQSFRNFDWNAIDPNVIFDDAGTPWMVYGSYWSGIKMRKLDLNTGKLATDDTTTHELARRTIERDGTRAIEAPFIVQKNGWYYLFVSFDRQPVNYNIRVGRSRDLTGPYLDRNGVDMMQGGGTLVLEEHGYVTAPGHNGVMLNDDPPQGPEVDGGDGTDWLIHHYKDARYDGNRVQAMRELVWGQDGWPLVGPGHSREQLTAYTQPVTVGTWNHFTGYGDPTAVSHRFLPDGSINSPDSGATWTLDDNDLTLRWPSSNAPGGAWVDRLTLADNGRWYVGRNQHGTIIRAERTIADFVAPQVTSTAFEFETEHAVRVQFSEDVVASLTAGDVAIENVTAGTTVPVGSIELSYDVVTDMATFRFPGEANGLLADGNYRITFADDAVADAEGNALVGDASFEFFVLAGDANRDRAVSLADFLVLRSNFGQSGKVFSEGDFNYDGTVSLADFLVLRSKFGQGLPQLTAPPTLFADTKGDQDGNAAKGVLR